VCKSKVKITNLEKHFVNVHPRLVNELKIVNPIDGKCIICGKNIEIGSEYVCEQHKVKIIQQFLVREALLRLRKQTDQIILKSGNECIDYFLQFFLLSLYAELGTDTMEIDHERLVILSDRSHFLSYVLLRFCQAAPNFVERAYEVASRDEGGGEVRTRYDAEFLELLLSEFEFFYALYFGVQGLFNVATDSMKKPSTVVIIPDSRREAVIQMLMLRLKDSEFVYRCSFYPIIHRTSEECVFDEKGGFFCYPREKISANYQLFNELWVKFFGSKLELDASQFQDFRQYFKWVVSPFGFTKKKKNKAYWLAEFEDLDDEELFYLLDTILPEVCSKQDIISTKSLGTFDVNHNTLRKMMRIAHGFRVQSQKGTAYFLPVIEWLYNLLAPLLVQFGRSIKAPGNFFEKWFENVIKSSTNGSLGFKFTREFGYVPIVRNEVREEAVKDWRILEKGFKIVLPDQTDPNTIPEMGEIDLIIYANYSLYLLELKSINLSTKKTVKHLKKKASHQCSKYARWIRNGDNLRSIMEKHGITDNKLRSVRILCCTNGVYDKTSIIDSNTNERFAVLPTFLLINLFSGVFTLSVRDVFPNFVKHIKNGLYFAFPTLQGSYLLNNVEKINETANQIIHDWYNLMTFDRRRDFRLFKESKPPPFTLAKIYIRREEYIGDTSNWILDQPILLNRQEGFSYYVGTQIGNAGTTLICHECQSAIKYYFGQEEDNLNVQRIIENMKCPLCKKTVNADKDPQILGQMSKCVLEFRKKLDSKLLGDN